jgi:hypothetical protein
VPFIRGYLRAGGVLGNRGQRSRAEWDRSPLRIPLKGFSTLQYKASLVWSLGSGFGSFCNLKIPFVWCLLLLLLLFALLFAGNGPDIEGKKYMKTTKRKKMQKMQSKCKTNAKNGLVPLNWLRY